jgi:hypothetical protein
VSGGNRIATLCANSVGGNDQTQREARTLGGEWYRRCVNQLDEKPGQSRHWAKLRRSCCCARVIVVPISQNGGASGS